MSPMLDISIAVPPQNRLLKSIYDFSFDVMSNALLRTLIYLVTVVMLVIVSILHLVRSNRIVWNVIKLFYNFLLLIRSPQVECSNEYSNDELGSFSSCLNSWVILLFCLQYPCWWRLKCAIDRIQINLSIFPLSFSVGHAMSRSDAARDVHVPADTFHAEANCGNNYKLHLLLHNFRSR